MHFYLALLAVFVLLGSPSQAQSNRKDQVQTMFCEDSMSHPVKLPKAALKAVERAASSLQRDMSMCSFKASAIDLNDDGLEDFVVRGTGYCSGADNFWFWIVTNDKGHYRVTEMTGVSCIEVLPTKTNGFRDIRTTWEITSMGATRLWHYGKYDYICVRHWHHTNRWSK